MPTVTGVIRDETGGPALGATVRAFDKDMRHEQLLGSVVITETSGRYEITYTPEQFRRAEKKTADLKVYAFDAQDKLRAESEIRFNARELERIDLTFAPLPTVERRLTELENLQESIEPVREKVAYLDFTNLDLTFLTEESIRAGTLGIFERRTIRQRLEFLRLADQFARATNLPLAAFYGWFRQDQPQVLAELFDQPNRVLREALETAIVERIIPDIRRQISDILERVSNLRLEEGRLVRHRFVVQLINAATDRPLAGYTIGVLDLAADADNQDLGTVFTDGRGVCSLIFSLPQNAPATATRELQLNIVDNGVTVAEVGVMARPDQHEVAVVRVALREDEHANVLVEEMPSVPTELVTRLRARGINTLRDLLAHPAITDDDEEELDRLRANAKFAVLAPELSEAERANLLDSGFRSPLDIGATSRAEFVSNQHETLGGDPPTYGTHFAARETRKLFVHMVGSAWLKNVTTPDDEPPDPDIPTGVDDLLNGLRTCGCKDCTSAVSPAAYLAHLLEWTLEHIKSGTASIQFSQLAEEFHQPFGDLPASCSAVETQVRQVRICVEALWRFTGFLDRADLQFPTPFRNAYRHLRNQLYQGILTNLGTSFEQLRRAVLQIQGDTVAAAEIAAQRQAVADLLGIDQTHLIELFFNIEQPPISPSEDDLQQRFGYRSTRLANVFTPLSTPPDLITWQRERLESIWQDQDWSNDTYSGEDRLPFVDPALIDETYLRTPLEQNAAFALLEARRSELETHRQSLVDQQPQQNGVAALLEDELETSIEELRSVFGTLQSTDAPTEEVVQAQETIAALNLTRAGFTHLMEIDAHQQAGEPIALTEESIEAAWASAFDILSRAHRHTIFPTWVDEENDFELVFGPKLFWLPIEPLLTTSSWIATTSERAEWQTALARRSQRPIIDPDQITQNHIIVMMVFTPPNNSLELGFTSTTITPPLQAINLWQERRDWVDERLSGVREARQDQGNSLATLDAVLQASTLGLDLQTLEDLANQEFTGQNIEPRLAQLSLTMPEFRFLAGIRELALANENVQSHSWQEVDAILIQAEKQREFAEWRLAEQAAEISLHPHRFVAPAEPVEQDESPQIRWLHDAGALEQWLDTLAARSEQFKALSAGLAEAIGKAEELVLPLLRNILIMETIAPGNSLAAKADWMDRRLLIDMHLSGCQMTSRISQAIETLQRFIRGVYTQDHLDVMDHLTLDAIEDYELEWPVLGSYATWRAFMLAYLYPENLLNVTPPNRQSHGYLSLTSKLRNAIAPEQACEYSKAYFEYFRDVCNLDIEAVCQVEMVQTSTVACEPTSLNLVQRTHLFARSRETGNVYWAQLDPTAGAEDTMTTWTPLGELGPVDKILGATLHNAGVKRYILVFAETPAVLLLRKYDLDDGRWLGVKKLDWPPGYEHGILSGAVVQKRQINLSIKSEFNLPTLVAVTVKDGVSYIRKLRLDAEGWDENDWFPLYGPSLADPGRRIAALIEIASNSYAIVANLNSEVRYRTAVADDLIPLKQDDYEWKYMAPGSFRGAFPSPGQSLLFCFFFTGGVQSKYRTVQLALNEPEEADSEYDFSDVADFNENWFIPNIGVSLDDTNLFKFEHYAPDFFIPRHALNEPDWHPLETSIDGVDIPIALGDWNGDVYFTGSVLGLITRTLEDFEQYFHFTPIEGGEMPEFWDDPNDLYFYLFQQKYYGIQQFLEHIKNIDSVSYAHPTLGWWKYANDRIKELSVDNLTLAELVQKFLVNQLLEDKERWAPRNSPSGPIRFVQRHEDDLNPSVKISDDDWNVAPHSGVEATNADGNRRMTVIQMKGDLHSVPVRVPTTISGSSLAATAKYELAPYGDGPFNSLPEQNASALQQRAEDTKNIYCLLKTAPPSVKSYLQEAYLLVPTLLAHRLQRSGFFAEALVWYRLVFDYLAPSSERKICFGLVEEQNLSLDYDRADDFLNDATNTHAIAATRKNTYTRHVLLLIVRCLIDYADALFSRDNAADNAQARELYRQALKLLESNELTPGTSPCDDILGQLEVEVVAPAQLPLKQFKAALGQIGEPDRLLTVASSLTTINENTALQPIERLSAMRDVLVNTLRDLPVAASFEEALNAKHRVTQLLENHFAADGPSSALLRSTQERRRDLAINQVLEIVRDDSGSEVQEVPWLRAARPAGRNRDEDEPPVLALRTPPASTRLSTVMQIRRNAPLLSLTANVPGSFAISNGVSFNFCIPQNPVITALRTRAANNLTKLRTCRNIAGFLRQVDLYGAPIGLGSGLVSANGAVFSGIVTAPPTPYRYQVVIGRAKDLTAIAQQLEAGYQAALESAEREALSVLQAQQNVEMAQARVVLQDLRVVQAANEIGMAQLQKSSAVFREATYAGFISAGLNASETMMLNAYSDAAEAQKQAARARAASSVAQTVAAMAGAWSISGALTGVAAFQNIAQSAAISATLAEAGFQERAINAEAQAQAASFQASFERRNDEWQLQQGLAALDVVIGDQQITLAQNQADIVQQERVIAGMEQTHAVDVLQFLLSKTFTEEMYRWIASVLEDAYRFFLQEATAMARLAEQQLAFERQQDPLKVVQSDYWKLPADAVTGGTVDRLGLTGSARLLKDIFQLDNYAFETRRRKQALTITLDLAEMFPLEFQRFRETGVLIFNTSLSLIDRQFPGYYLCLIQQLNISVVALVPPTRGIRATCTSAGISRAVVGGDTFQTVTIRNLPERIAMTAATTSSSVMELEPDSQSLLNPFEGTGFDTMWELKMPKAANPFDYNTIATVLFTVNMTALHSFDYEREVIERFERKVSFERAFDFRHVFADAWYDLNNPDQTTTPMVVRFETRRTDFPVNLTKLAIQHVVLYLVRSDGETFEQSIQHLHFTAQGTPGAAGGPASTVDGRVSTRSGNGVNWLSMIGHEPIGVWELAFPDQPAADVQARGRFANEQIADLLLVLTISGETASFPP